MFSEDEFLPLSALQHLLYCERRAGLIYIEGIWDENPYTVEGRQLHERTHSSETESRGNIRIARGLLLRSLRLGLSGKADVVEFHRLHENSTERPQYDSTSEGIRLEGISGFWRPFPVEYKRGRLRHEEGYEVQLCAQAICLEEMLDVIVPSGALFYGKTGRRLELAFDMDLRVETETAAHRLHELIHGEVTPVACYSKKCERCSLNELCIPKTISRRRSVEQYLADVVREPEGGTGETSS